MWFLVPPIFYYREVKDTIKHSSLIVFFNLFSVKQDFWRLKAQYIGIKAIQSCYISKSVKSLLTIAQWYIVVEELCKVNLSVLVRIVRASKVVITNLLVRKEVYSTMILWQAIRLMLHWNNEPVCLPYQLLISIKVYDHYHFTWKSFLGWEWNSMLS